MKRSLLMLLSMLLVGTLAEAQVVADFESEAGGTQNVSDGNWGTFITSISRVADPSGKSAGVLQVAIDAADHRPNGDPKDAITLSGVKTLKGKYFAYKLWLPADMPDNIGIEPFIQTGDSWTWQNASYLSQNLEKGKWITVVLDLDAMVAGGADLNKVQAIGVQIQGWGVAANTTWTGNVYVDNISILGAEPTMLAQFEDEAAGTQGFGDENWGTLITGLARVTDPSTKSAGVLEVSIDAKDYRPNGDPKDPMATTSVKTLHGDFLVYQVWLPADVPNGISINPFFQTGDSWTWQNVTFLSENIEKEKWVSLLVDLNALVDGGANLDKVQKMGIEFQGYNVAAGSEWTGKIYVDNISVLGTETGSKWVVADFNSSVGGTYGFATESWAPAFTSIQNVVDPANGGNRVLQANMTVASGAESKAVITKNNVSLWSTETDTNATAISFDVFFPADVPLGADVGMVIRDGNVNGGWVELKFALDDAAVVRGKWNKLVIPDIAEKIATGVIIDKKKSVNFSVQIYYSTSATAWSGAILFDNLTVVGIPEPKGSLESPTLVTSVASYAIPTYAAYQYVKLEWTDNKLGTETYNIYQSESPISDVNADGVRKIVGGVPHGTQGYPVRPWSADGSMKSYYYAITAFDGLNETPLRPESKSGKVDVQTSPAYKVQYVKNFAFQLDGVDDEFVAYQANQIRPDIAGEGRSAGWTSESKDMNFKTTLIIDDKYLYISADVDDDDLRHDALAQAWQGDALEFYIGFYDRRPLKAEHAKNYSHANGDWRIGFNSDGFSTSEGGAATAIPGVESTVFEKLTADGYIIEAQIALDSMAAGKKFTFEENMMMPLRIDGNDMDVLKGESGRGLIVQGGGVYQDPASPLPTDEDWKRPDGWGSLMVVGYTKVGVEETNNGLPKEFNLYQNYPNPFNPATLVKYDVAKETLVSIKVYDLIGREVQTLVNNNMRPGSYSTRFDGRNLSSGIYLVRITAGQFQKTMKMTLVK